MPYSLKYAIFHWVIHFSLATVAAWLLVLSFSNLSDNQVLISYLLVYFGTVAIDIDHLPVLIKGGVKGILKAAKIRNYPIHNFLYLTGFILLFFGSFLTKNVFLSAFLLGIVVHMIFDLIEDVVWGIGVNHWKI